MQRITLPLRVAVAFCLTLLLGGCGSSENGWPDKPGPKVAVSFPPLYSFALNVAGDEAAVRTIMTSHGPHHFDPKPSDHRLLHGADAFFINGLTLDEQTAKLMKNGSGNRDLRIINLGEKINQDDLEEGCDCHHEGEDGHTHTHAHSTDPHVWLALEMAELQVNGIRDGLKELAPDRAAGYDRRAAEYAAKLRALRDEGKAMFKDKKDRRFVTFHGSLAYFARSFDLDIAEVIQKTPGKEPTGKELQHIVDVCLEYKPPVRVIAVEPQYTSQAAAKRILDELRQKGVADAELVEIDPLETANEADLSAGWYEAKMRANIAALAKALK